ncbi:hypothetical protein Barb4_02127 [Bacteroidales bacterium Barb4]|nr:hypothetical protein Barb4_02127 [Bacteroidales bacterium Barb4]
MRVIVVFFNVLFSYFADVSQDVGGIGIFVVPERAGTDVETGKPVQLLL